MHKHNNHTHLILGILCFVVLSSCTPTANSNTLEVKDKKEVVSENIGSESKDIDFQVDDTQAKILIEKDSVDQATSITVSTAEITKNNLSVVTQPISPLISIEVSQPLKKALKVQIPIKKKENEVVAAVSYQINDNLVDTLDSVFTDNEVLEIMISASTDFFISSVAEDLVLATIDSGFRPIVDGFQIPNISTYWQKKGMCSGMVNGAMYYYLHKKSTLGALNNHYNESAIAPFPTPSFVIDDLSAITLTAKLQSVADPDSFRDFFVNTRLENASQHFYRMAYHMMLSNKPQVVHLFDKAYSADQSNDPTIGHAVIVYKIAANHAYIYDPNYPNNETLKIELDIESDSIVPYVGATSADSNQTQFKNMYYYPIEHIINETEIGSLFNKVDNKEAVVTTPDYELVEVIRSTNNTTYAKLSNTHKTPKDTIEITLKSPANGYVRIYDKNQVYVELIHNNTITLSLPEEDNYYGFEILLTESSNPTKGLYSDFHWINIQKVTYDPWTVTSTITSINSNHYSQNEIDQMLNVTFTTPLLVLYDEEKQQFDTINPENNQKVIMEKTNNNIHYEVSYPLNNDTLINIFDGTISDDFKTITGVNIVLSASEGEYYRMNVVMRKNE